MFTYSEKKCRLISILTAVLLLAALIFQFTPFWTYGDTAVSVQGYTWFPGRHTGLTSQFREVNGAFEVGQAVGMPVLQLVAGILALFFCVKNSTRPMLSGICGILFGIGGIASFGADPLFRLGSTWLLQLILAIAVLLLGAYLLALAISSAVQRYRAYQSNGRA